MRAVHVRIRHQNDLVIAQLFNIEFIASNPRSKRHHKVTNLLASKHAVKARALHVEDLAFKRQNSLCATVAPSLGRAASGVPFHDEKLCFAWVFLRAILEFSSEEIHVHCRLAPRQFSRLARRLTGMSCFNNLANNCFGLLRVFFKPFGKFVAHQTFDNWAHFRAHQFIFGLT